MTFEELDAAMKLIKEHPWRPPELILSLEEYNKLVTLQKEIEDEII